MIKKSDSTSLALATIAILGQAPRWAVINNHPEVTTAAGIFFWTGKVK